MTRFVLCRRCREEEEEEEEEGKNCNKMTALINIYKFNERVFLCQSRQRHPGTSNSNHGLEDGAGMQPQSALLC